MANFNDFDPLPPNATLQQRVQRLEAYVELMDRNFYEEIQRMLHHKHPELQRARPTTTHGIFQVPPDLSELGALTRNPSDFRRACCNSLYGDPHKADCDNYEETE